MCICKIKIVDSSNENERLEYKEIVWYCSIHQTITLIITKITIKFQGHILEDIE